MTDLNRHSDDELVSAVLDGEATAEEAARVHADPELRRRLEAFRGVAAAVAAPPPNSSVDQREVLLAAALGAAAEPEPEVEGEASGAEVIPLGRSRRMPPTYLIGIAAAAVLLVLLAVPLALRDGGRGSGDTQTAAAPTTLLDNQADRTSEQATGTEPLSADAAPDEEGLPLFDDPPLEDPALSAGEDTTPLTSVAGDPTATSPLPATGAVELALVPLGSFESRDDATIVVTQAVIDARDADRLAPTPWVADDDADSSATPCLEQIRAGDDELEALVWAGSLDLPDGEHQLLLFRLTPSLGANGDYRLYEVLTGDCSVISEDTLD